MAIAISSYGRTLSERTGETRLAMDTTKFKRRPKTPWQRPLDVYHVNFPRALRPWQNTDVASSINLLKLPAALLFLLTCPAWAEPQPAVQWNFDGSDKHALKAYPGIKHQEHGPRAPEFPTHSKTNQAIYLNGQRTRLTLPDTFGEKSPFKYRNGDAITIEAWIKPDGSRNSVAAYIVGKGRTSNPKFKKDNQNWSLRIATSGGRNELSFLFATKAGTWHRWNSTLSFGSRSVWHHIALRYEFGRPEAIRGWIDGVPTDGTWNLGGPTKSQPFVDDDALWIGSALGGNTGNCFRGWMDAIAIHRRLLDDKTIASRYQSKGGPRLNRTLPPAMPKITGIPDGRVQFTITEGLAYETQWLAPPDKELLRWTDDAFLLPRIPIRYDSYGNRAAWQVPLLLRVAGDVRLPLGKQKFMMRTRALSRLWIDGQLVATGKAITVQPPNGEEPVTPVRQPALPGLRVAGYHQQEVFGEAEITNQVSRVVYETVVGGKQLRPETGEVLIALQTRDAQSYSVLRTGERALLPLTDEATVPELDRMQAELAEFDDANRRRRAATQDNYWNRRHQHAKDWARDNQAPSVPRIAGIKNPIDAFITSKISRAIGASAKTEQKDAKRFHSQILPLLRQRCIRCHGEKEKGGLKLDNRDRLLDAVTPGKPGESELIARIRSHDEDERMPPTGDPLTAEQIDLLTAWIKSGAAWPAPPIAADQVKQLPVVDDAKFIRRAYLDTVGVPPSADQVTQFLADRNPRKRKQLIRGLTAEERAADHWTSYWQDMLAENPALLNQAQGSTGPFRWFVHESLRDNKALDRMVTELIMLRGGKYEGGAAGFGMAAENDAPFAAKGHIIASAFLGIELQCARCHDPPYHSSTQRDLYSLAAMFQRKSAGVPKTSLVPAEFFENRERRALIQVTLKPGEQVPPKWRFAKLTGADDGEQINRLMRDPKDTRERMAVLMTSPENRRFARVVVNRVWNRLMGAGFVEPVHDWEGQVPSHPELLDWLAHKLVASGYNPLAIIRLILESDTYQRPAIEGNLAASPELRFFHGPERRRLSAEQIVDSLYVTTGKEMDIGELTFVHDGKRALSNRQTLGFPKRAWMLANLNNERDRPSLSLPQARAIVDVLEAFGWKGTRQQPIYHRETEPNVLQPGILANGVLVSSLARASSTVPSPISRSKLIPSSSW